MGGGASTNTANKPINDLGPEFTCSLVTEIKGVDVKNVILRVGSESLSILDTSYKPLKVFVYHQIISWGHNAKSFRWKFLVHGKQHTYIVMTDEGKTLEHLLLDNVKKLMKVMESKGIDNPAFDALLTEVKHKGVAAVRTQSRAFTSHQAVQVLQSIEHDFEKIETAAVIYDKLINKNSFQLVLNEFSNKADRENLCVRLHINFQENGITADCPDGLNRTETTTASPAVDRCQKGASISKENSPSQTVAVSSLDSTPDKSDGVKLQVES